MNINKWKSVAIKKTDYLLLKGLCKEKFRAPGAMISKLLSDHIKHKAQKEKISTESLEKRLINGSAQK